MSEWDEVAAGWDTDEAVRAYAGGAHTSLIALADDVGFDLADATVCDFGCGTGLLTERIAAAARRVDAVDTSPAMREVLTAKVARHGWGHVRVLGSLPAEPTRYDLIVCSSVLAFVDDHPATVAELVGHLAPDGLLVQWDWAADPGDPDGGGLSPDEIEGALVGAGLRGVGVRTGFEAEAYGQVMSPLMGFGRRAG